MMHVAAGSCPCRWWPDGRTRLHVTLHLRRVETGETNVGIGIYAGVLQVLGLLEGLSQIADIGNDPFGQALASAVLPKHVHRQRRGTRPQRERGVSHTARGHDTMRADQLLLSFRQGRTRGDLPRYARPY